MHYLLENSVKLKAESLKLVLWLSALCFTLSAFTLPPHMRLNQEQPTSFSNQKMVDRHGKTSARVCLNMNSQKIFLQASRISTYV